MKKLNFLLAILISSFLLTSCGGNDLKNLLGTWKCVECGENVAEYTYKFESFGNCVIEGETFRYLGTWEDQFGDLEQIVITYDGSFDRYYIKELTKTKLVLEKDDKQFVYEKVE